jgi:hypothetical protein
MKMKFALKQSHFFAAAFFGITVSWFVGLQAVRASAGAISWSDIPGLVMLAILVNGLLAIVFNFVWLKVLERQGKSSEEPENYQPTKSLVERLAIVAVLATTSGWLQGYALLKYFGGSAQMAMTNCWFV